MMRNISVGIDIGSSKTRVVVGEYTKNGRSPKIIGVGEAKTEGVRHGYIISISDATNSLRKAVKMAEKTSGIKIKKAIVSINTITLRGKMSNGNTIVSKADSEVTKLDVNKAIDDSEEALSLSNNKKIIQAFPVLFKLDGKKILGRPEGMHGNKLEVKTMFITLNNQHFEDLVEVLTEIGIKPTEIIAAPIAGSMLSLSKKQKIVGGAVVNLGAETVSIAVFEDEVPIHVHTFSIGCEDITNDIALGLKIDLEKAKKLKIENEGIEYPKKKVDEIIKARISDVLELFQNHLKKIKRDSLLPAGVSWTGGGAKTKDIVEFSKKFLNLPSRVAETEYFSNMKNKLRDPAWLTVLGLLVYNEGGDYYGDESFKKTIREIKGILKRGIKQLMP